MEEQKKSTYNGYTEARKAANKKYQDGRARQSIWLDPEDKPRIQAAAAAAGESVNQYMITATLQRIEREKI